MVGLSVSVVQLIGGLNEDIRMVLCSDGGYVSRVPSLTCGAIMTLHPLAYQREAERCEHLARLTLAQDRGAVRCAARLRKLARVMRMKAEGGL